MMIQKKKWETIAAKCQKMRTMKVGLSMMREWTEKIQAKEMSMAMKMTRWKTRKRKSPIKSSQFKNRIKRLQRLSKRTCLKRKNRRFQEHHGDKKRKKKKNKH